MPTMPTVRDGDHGDRPLRRGAEFGIAMLLITKKAHQCAPRFEHPGQQQQTPQVGSGVGTQIPCVCACVLQRCMRASALIHRDDASRGSLPEARTRMRCRLPRDLHRSDDRQVPKTCQGSWSRAHSTLGLEAKAILISACHLLAFAVILGELFALASLSTSSMCFQHPTRWPPGSPRLLPVSRREGSSAKGLKSWRR